MNAAWKRDGGALRRGAEQRLREGAGVPVAEADAARLVHELQVHRIELEMQNEELRQAQQERERYLAQLEEMVAATTAAKEKAERASRAKSDFLAMAGHELRSPLTHLMIVAHLLSANLERNLNPQQLEYARMIEDASNDLLHLVDDMLDLARVEAQALAVDQRTVLFPDLLLGVQRTYRELARHKGLEFAMQVDADVPPAMVTDPLRLRQVLRNLLGNALRFTGEGSVTLSVRMAPPDIGRQLAMPAGTGKMVAFAVADTGAGIPAGNQAGIFEPAAPGSCIGLPVARRIARLLGGDILLDSERGKGSTFTVYLPLAPAGTN